MRQLTLEALADWIEFRFDRGGGPGGQNVNKVSTRVWLRLAFERCPAFSEAQRARIRSSLARRIDAQGQLTIVAQTERSQSGNRAAALERLLPLLQTALHVPKTRRPTAPSAASDRRRLRAKKERSDVKRFRSGRDAAPD